MAAESGFLRTLSSRTALLAVCAVALLSFVESLGFEFVYDDAGQVVSNPYIVSWSNFPEYFTRPVALNFYRPFFMVWLFINRQLFGLDPAYWHLSSVLMHVLASALVFLLARRLLKGTTAAAFAALLFAVHPVHIEAVSWVSGITEPMVTVFTLGSFLVFLRSREGNRASWLSLSCFLAAAAMLSKETGVVVVFLIFAYVFLASPGPWLQRSREALSTAAPFMAVAATYFVARVLVLGALVRPVGSTLSIAEMLLTWPRAIWFYIAKLTWPFDLAVYYELPAVSSPFSADFLLPLLSLAVVGIPLFVIAMKARDQHLLFPAAWMLLALSPALYFRAFLLNDYVHDRYLYLPSVGFVLIVARLVALLAESRIQVPGFPRLAPAVATVTIFTMSLFGTLAQQPYWRSNLMLFYRALQISPTNEYVLNNLGTIMQNRGEHAQAIEFYRRALESNPRHWAAQFNLALFLYRIGRLDEADQAFARAEALNPKHSLTLANHALVRMYKRDFAGAHTLIQEAIRLQPAVAEYHYTLGRILQAQGNVAAAQIAFRDTLQLDPSHAGANQALAQK